MSNVLQYNPHYKRYKTNPYSDFTWFQELDALTGGTPLKEISEKQEANIIASTNKTNSELAQKMAEGNALLSGATLKNIKIQLYVAIAFIIVLTFVIIYLKRKK